MTSMPTEHPTSKDDFLTCLTEFANSLNAEVHDNDGQWSIKGFIDVYRKVYSITSDTKIVSKILEIQLLPHFIAFADKCGFIWRPAERQNWYPDMSFINKKDDTIKFAVDIKTTYRIDDAPGYCNGFTLGSHGEYFINRTSTKNIQYPYGSYLGHYTLGIIYSRKLLTYLQESQTYTVDQIEEIPSVIANLEFFAVEKWKIAGDKGGSGNTANIGSIHNIEDMKNGRGMFSKLGEEMFDDYWTNYNKIAMPGVTTNKGKPKYITSLKDYLSYRNFDEKFINEMIVARQTSAKVRAAIKRELKAEKENKTEDIVEEIENDK